MEDVVDIEFKKKRGRPRKEDYPGDDASAIDTGKAKKKKKGKQMERDDDDEMPRVSSDDGR